MLKTFEKYRNLVEKLPTKRQINDIYFFIQRGFYGQMINNNPTIFPAIIIKHFEIEEKYRICARIKTAVDNHNKNYGTKIPTTLDI